MNQKDIEELMRSEFAKEFGSFTITDKVRISICSKIAYDLLSKEIDESETKIETLKNLYHSYRNDFMDQREEIEELKQQLKVDESELSKYRKHYGMHGANKG